MKKNVNSDQINDEKRTSEIFNELIKRQLLNKYEVVLNKVRSLKDYKLISKLYILILITELNKIYDSIFGYNFLYELLSMIGIKENLIEKILNRKDKFESISIISYIIFQFIK